MKARILLDASAGGTIRTLNEPLVKELIEKMSLNEYNFANTSGIESVVTKNNSHSKLTLRGYEELLTKLEVLNQKLNGAKKMPESLNKVMFGLCTNCGKENFAGNCTKAQVTEDV